MLCTDQLADTIEEMKAKLYVSELCSYDMFSYYCKVLDEVYETYCEHYDKLKKDDDNA